MQDRNRNLDEALAALRSDALDPQTEAASAQRAWQAIEAATTEPEGDIAHIRGCKDVRALLPAFRNGHLSASRALLVQDHLRDCAACRRVAQGDSADSGAAAWRPESPAVAPWQWRRWAMAAAVVLAVAVGALLLSRFLNPSGPRATLQAAEGSVYRMSGNGAQPIVPGATLSEGELVRTAAGGHAYLRLYDGSIVEMGSRTELKVNAGLRDATIHLDGGRVIVQAAKRSSGHLFVKAPDLKVAVTGTVFSVDSGMKGSRVAVIEGTVQVATATGDSVLHSGDEVGTGGEAAFVPVADEISWSQDREKHLALLAEFARLQNKIYQQVHEPAPRHQSSLLALVPAESVIYIGIPNLGETLAQANQVFQRELQESAVLRQWWNEHKDPRHGEEFSSMIDRVQTLSRYLGDEVVFVGFRGDGRHDSGAMLAAVTKPGLGEFVKGEAERINAERNNDAKIVVVDAGQLSSLSPAQDGKALFVLVRSDYLVASPSLASLRRMNAQLNAGASGFATGPFGEAIRKAYDRGAGILIAANVHDMQQNERRPKRPTQQAGFENLQFLIIEHREEGGVPDNRATLDFLGARTGVASWLGNPAPIRSLEFISPNASIVVAGLSKSPAAMLDDILAMSRGREGKGKDELREFETKSGVNLRNDLAASLGGEFAVALDGPPLPTPSWKFIAEVTNQTQLESAMERLVTAANRDMADHDRPQLTFTKNESATPPDYAISGSKPGQQVHYTFVDGYLVAAPTRAMVLQAIEVHQSGVNVAVSQGFRSLLPQDGQPNVSAVFYQNLAPMLDQFASQLSSAQLDALRQIAADSKPTVIVAYGGNNRIQFASTARFPDLNALAFSTLLHGKKNRTGGPANP